MTATPDAPRPALGELAREFDIADVAEAARILIDLRACYKAHTDAGEHDRAASLRRPLQQAFEAFTDEATPEAVLQLVALATGGGAMRESLRRVGIGTSDECGDTGAMVEWFATTEQGEQGCGTLDEALAVLTDASTEDGRREALADRTRLAGEVASVVDAARVVGTAEWKDGHLIVPQAAAEALFNAAYSTKYAARSLTPERPADA